MKQPVPKVTEQDVTRIAVRDFGDDKLSQVLAVLEEYGKQEWNSPTDPRVLLCILKLADGDLELLAKYTETAIQDYRDVIAWAEYPGWSKEIGLEDVPRDLEQEVIETDWRQYCRWLGREVEQISVDGR